MSLQQLRLSNKHNDERGDVYFYYNENKKSIYLRVHTDRKSTVDRKATEKDKKNYSQQWEIFNRKRTKK